MVDEDALEPAEETEIPILGITTFPDLETGRQIARTLVQERLVACVNLLPSVSSIYRWEGKVEEGNEVQGIIKTSEDRIADLMELFLELHPYDVPELVFTPVVAGTSDYLDWVVESTRGA